MDQCYHDMWSYATTMYMCNREFPLISDIIFSGLKAHINELQRLLLAVRNISRARSYTMPSSVT